MTKRYLATSWLLLSAAALSGCGGLPCGNGHPYTGSTSRPPLKAPSGLTVPAPDPAYLIPGEGKPTPPADADDTGACIIVPPNVLPAASSRAAPAAATAAPAAPAIKTQPAPAATSKAPPVAAGGPLG